MKVFVLDHATAKKFIPDKPTLAIRIYDSPGISKTSDNQAGIPLQPSENWINVLEYTFDDFDLNRYSSEYVTKNLPEWKLKFTLLDKTLAKKIISDFSDYCNADQVMIHCTWGWNRSPATIQALQKVFDLDIEWANLRTQRIIEAKNLMSNSNSHVYQLLTEASENEMTND